MRIVKIFFFVVCFMAIIISYSSLFADAVTASASTTGTGNNVATASSPQTVAGATPAPSMQATSTDMINTTTTNEGLQKATIVGQDFFNPAKGIDILNLSKDKAVQPDYLIKNGDEIVIDIWGDLDFHYSLPVNKDGYIVIPNVGRVDLNGLTFAEAKNKIINKLADTYNFYIDANNPGAGKAHVDITMGKIAGIQVYVTGEVKTPGEIYLNGTNSSVIAALRAAGGITNLGSIRNIRVIHPDGKETIFNLYDFLFYGKLTSDNKYLKDGDTINVPFRTSQVTVTGAVVRPGMYEVADTDTLQNIISLAGGLVKEASGKIKICREQKNVTLESGVGEKEVLSIDYFNQNNSDNNLKLDSGDIILAELLPMVKVYDTVKIQGNGIKNPGEYKYTKGLRISDYIEKAGGLYQDTENKVDLLRYTNDLKTIIIPLELKEIQENTLTQNLELKPGDIITFYNTKDVYGTQYISLEGHVKNPGKYLYHKGVTALDLLVREGGLMDKDFLSNTYLKQANIFRMDLVTQRKEVISFQLGKLLDGDIKENVELQPGDKVVVYDLAAMQVIKNVTIEGEVNKPGTYRIDENANLNSVIIEAGGFKPDALIEEIEIGMKGTKYSKIYTTIDYNTPAGKNYVLKNNDFIIVHKDPYYEIRNAIVEVSGEVRIPGKYNYIKDEKIAALIKRAGGLRDNVFLEGTEFYHDGQRVQIDLKKSLEEQDTNYNFIVLSNDRIFIPEKKYFVDVKGAVTSSKKFICINGKTASYYIDLAGGFTSNADKGQTKIIAPDGSIKNAFSFLWFADPEVEPGSIIDVPVKN